MNLDVLPVRTAGAAENMAVDFLLLQRYPRPEVPRFRHYDWRAPAFTFGYAQKIDFVRGQLPADGPYDLCRRPTGGGIVDHRDDWTYALVIPRGHALEEVRATESYRAAHGALVDALADQGVAATLKLQPDEPAPEPLAPGICFQRAEVYDVIRADGSGLKIAGAAQKRNKHGLLFQGSIARAAIAGNFNWDTFAEELPQRLAAALGMQAMDRGWPDFDNEEVSALTEQYASAEWLEHR